MSSSLRKKTRKDALWRLNYCCTSLNFLINRKDAVSNDDVSKCENLGSSAEAKTLFNYLF